MSPYILAVGACYVDTILDVSSYPREDEKLRAQRVSHRRGGNCPNTLEVLRQLLNVRNPRDISLALCAALPASSCVATKAIKDSLPGVSFNSCFYRNDRNEAASSYVIRSKKTSSRTIVNYNDLPEMDLAEFKATIGHNFEQDQISWCHFEGRIPDITLDCIKHIKDKYPRTTISVEIEKPGRLGLESLAKEAHVVFYSCSWAMSKGYRSAQGCLENESTQCPQALLMCCTWGADGATAAVKSLGSAHWTYMHAAPKDVDMIVVDSVGAGDTLVAGVLHHLLCCADDDKVLSQEGLDIAVKLAGRKVQQEGFSGLAEQI